MYNNSYYTNKEERYALNYIAINAQGAEVSKTCYPRSKEQKEKNIQKCKELGYKVVSCKKLYPFSSNKNQHNFMLISNICSNRMYDMQSGELEYNEAEYDRLYELKDKADKYFGLELPVAWLPWEELKEAKELASMAVEHRISRCIEAGRSDLIQYC